MKKALAIMVLAAMVANVAAQESKEQTVVSPNANLELKIKNIEYKDHNAEITMLITNLTASEIMFNLVGGQYQTGMAGSVAYDDEGNVYEQSNVLVSVGNLTYAEQYSGQNIPSKVPVKCHLLIKNIDPEATELLKVKLCLLSPQLQINNTGVHFELNHLKLK